MIKLEYIHHTAIICSDYVRSKAFYTEVLGMEVLAETYRQERDSWKLDLALGGHYVIELFSFPAVPQRSSRPEAAGLRHLAFAVKDLHGSISWLAEKGVVCEPIRTDHLTGKRFTFFSDPDNLPLELYAI